MGSDLSKHPETEKHAAIGLGVKMLMNGLLNTPSEMARFIRGFNRNFGLGLDLFAGKARRSVWHKRNENRNHGENATGGDTVGKDRTPRDGHEPQRREESVA